MKKKIANAIQLVLLIVVFIILKMPTVSVKLVNSKTGITFEESMFDLMDHYQPTYYPFCVLSILLVIMCIISIVSKSGHRDGKVHSFLPVLWFINVNLCAIFVQGQIGVVEVVSYNFPATLFEICAFGIVVLGFAKRSSFIAGEPEEKVIIAQTIPQTTDADELGKYKELLDKGAITQEEYDAKKKQLLGL